MPDLESPLYLDQLDRHRRSGSHDQYGLQWGDPETVQPLRYIRDHWVLPYVDGAHDAVEIGPGGGRWTKYLLPFRTLYVVEYHKALLDELTRTISEAPNLVPVLGHGTDFPGVPMVDFAFSFDVFVHFDHNIIAGYLGNLREILKPGGNAVIHYGDQTKVMARLTPSFADNDPERMRELVKNAGFQILEEDLTTMWHSSLIRFTPG